MKKIFTKKLALALVFMATISVMPHVHDENCGYDATTDSGCEFGVTTYGFGHFGDQSWKLRSDQYLGSIAWNVNMF